MYNMYIPGPGQTRMLSLHITPWPAPSPSYIPSLIPHSFLKQTTTLTIRTLTESATLKHHPLNSTNMADEIHDSTAAGTAKDNIPTMSNPMDNIHGNVEDISNQASGYKVQPFPPPPPSFLPPTDAREGGPPMIGADRSYSPPSPTPTLRTARRRMQRRCLRSWGVKMRS